MGWRITKRFTFSASHQLAHLPEGHKCARLHGHNYIVELELASETLDPDGFVVDYGSLDFFRAWIAENLDHRHLNDVLGAEGGNDPRATTAEHLASMLYRVAVFHHHYPAVVRVASCTVRETETTSATYSED